MLQLRLQRQIYADARSPPPLPISFALVALTGDMYYGLRYPIIVALMTVVIGALFLPETKDRPVT